MQVTTDLILEQFAITTETTSIHPRVPTSDLLALWLAFCHHRLWDLLCMSDMNTNHMWVLWVSAESFPSFQASSESVSVDCFSLFILFPCTYTIFVIVANRILQIIHCSKWKTSYFCPSVQFCHEVTQLCVTICELMDCRTPSFPIHHKLPELTQIHVHWVGDAIQTSHSLSSPHAFNPSQHQSLLQWVSYLHQVVRVLGPKLQYRPSNEYSGLISFRIN